MALDPLTAVFDLGSKILDKFFPDPQQRAQAALELEKMRQSGELAQLAAETDIAKAQIAVNQQEAASNSLFIAGWRPFIGWVCGLAFFYHFVLQPLLAFAIANYTGQGAKLPDFDMDTLLTVLMGILGLGSMRTVEKIVGGKGKS